MRLLVDTNVFIASLTDEPERGDTATAVLNLDYEFVTSLLNLMELRAVLAKKKQIEQDRVERIIDDISDRVDVFYPEGSDIGEAYELQRETLLYTMDCILLALAADLDAELVTFDSELLSNGAMAPATLLESGI